MCFNLKKRKEVVTFSTQRPFYHSHLSEGKSDLKQKNTQLLIRQFLSKFFMPLPHSMVHFIQRVGTKNQKNKR